MRHDYDELSKMGEKVVRSTNCQSLPIRKGEYVRVRPADESEIKDVQKDVRFLKFTRVGVRMEVLEDPMHGNDWLDVRCGKDRMVWGQGDFRRTFVRLVDGVEFLGNELRAG